MKNLLACLTTLLVLPLSTSALANDVVSDGFISVIVDFQNDVSDSDVDSVVDDLRLMLTLNSKYSEPERVYITTIPVRYYREVVSRYSSHFIEHIEENGTYWIPEMLGIQEAPASSAPTPLAPAPTSFGEPNDPLWSKQWSFRMIDAPTAWKHTDGRGVTVAVIDTGVAYEDYEEFREVEDLRGVEFVPGYDFVNDDDHPNDDHGHGTHVAGTIAQSTNNSIGVTGIAHGSKIMPLKVLGSSGGGTAADIADAIRFAADEGANIINMSLGGGPRSMVMESAVAYAHKKGVVVICAAGNNARGTVEYPAAYPGAFAVSSVGPDGKLAYYSSYGKEIAISAPGGDKDKGGDTAAILQNTILPQSPAETDHYLAFQGTSMAAPHVAGAAALVIASGVTDVDKIEEVLKGTAQDAGARGWDERYGAGILNVGKAVQTASGKTTGLPYAFTGLSFLLAMTVVMKRWSKKARLGVGALIGTVCSASGLWFMGALGTWLGGLPFIGRLLEFLSHAIPDWDTALFGLSWHATAIWASAFPVVCLTIALVGMKRLRGFLVGMGLGWAAHLFVTAILMPSDIKFIPGSGGFLDTTWLIINTGLLLSLSALIARLHARYTEGR